MAQHINTIVDYTFYWIIAIWEYYFHTGDIEFVRRVAKKIPDMWELVENRLSEHGFIGGYADKGEFEKYRIIQDRLFKSDFDKFDEGDGLLPLNFEN